MMVGTECWEIRCQKYHRLRWEMAVWPDDFRHRRTCVLNVFLDSRKC